MAIPDFQTLMLPALKLSATGEIRLKDALEILSNEFNLTQEEREALLPSGNMTTMRNRIAWAVSYLFQAKLVQRPSRGFFTVTERGKKVLQNPPPKINIKFLEQYPEFLEFRYKRKSAKAVEAVGDEQAAETPEEEIENAYSEISAALKDELLSKVLEASPDFFERTIVKLLVSMGYGGSYEQAGVHLGKSGDGGVDGVINEDKLGLDLIYVQAKRYSPENSIGRPAIQAFAGSLIGFGANKGVFVTTSSFSKHAQDFASGIPQRIILIDGEMLTTLMLENNVGVRVHSALELKRIDEDFFIED